MHISLTEGGMPGPAVRGKADAGSCLPALLGMSHRDAPFQGLSEMHLLKAIDLRIHQEAYSASWHAHGVHPSNCSRPRSARGIASAHELIQGQV